MPNKVDERGLSFEGKLKSRLIAKIKCEMQNALYYADGLGSVPWLKTWGTQITIKSTWDEMSSLSPGISNVLSLHGAESVTTVFGGTGSAHATRLETITFIWRNSLLLEDQANDLRLKVNTDCSRIVNGPFVEADHKIVEFIYDNATVAATGVATTGNFSSPPFTVLQDDLTFVGTIGANFTPVWKFTRFTANTAGNLLSGTRSVTGEVIMTLGPLASEGKVANLKGPASLAEPAASQHNAAVIGGFVAT